MRDRLNSMPVWVLFILNWLIWSALLSATGLIRRESLAWMVLPAVIVAFVIAVAMTLALKARWRAEDRALGDASRTLRREASRATWTGPIPANPEIRAAAVRLAEEQLRRTRRVRPFLIVVMTLAAVSAIGAAVLGSPWQLLSVVFYFPVLILLLISPNRLRKRIALLSEPE
ncbi:MAG: hypothetical protein QOH03_402 [Kribbellaceae bacterium]|jgi:hypothetical protein|nr:hypothetical protein [Kribbellaceae bacterium]